MIAIEFITLGLVTIWFAGGALVAFLASVLGVALPLQILLFCVVSVLLLAVTRPLAVRFMNAGRAKTNVDRLIGEQGVVSEGINNLLAVGTVIVQGQEWTARSFNDAEIAKDKVVEITQISGVKLIVKEV
ncbi:NfeD family protein [Lachnospiraceae bacterium ZAX-1]